MSENVVDTAAESSVWRKWWLHLEKDRGARADLARCGTAVEVAFCPAFHLLVRMRGGPKADRVVQSLGVVAAVLAHVREDVPSAGTLAKQMAVPRGDKALVSETRLRQLLRTGDSDADERLISVIRIVRHLGGRASVHQLASDLARWDDRTKLRWATDYYETASPTRKGNE